MLITKIFFKKKKTKKAFKAFNKLLKLLGVLKALLYGRFKLYNYTSIDL